MVAIALLMIVAFSLSACSTNQRINDDANARSAYGGEDATAGNDFGEDDDYVYSLDDVSSLQGIYVLSSSEDSLKPVCTTDRVYYAVDYDNFDGTDFRREFSLYEYGEPDVVDRAAGEKLAIAGSSASSSTSIDTSCYLQKVSYSGYYQGSGVAGSVDDYEEIDGESTDSADFDISKHGIVMHRASSHEEYMDMMTSATVMNVAAGWYEGSAWVDGKIGLTVPYYFTGDKIEAVVTPTKNGYFLIDVDDLEEGVYVLKSYYLDNLDSDTYYLFEV